MATIQFDLVSPERKLASVEASEVQIPGADGDFTAMADHAPFLTTLRPGVMSVKAGNDVTEYVVTGGFVEISGTSATVLAESAMPKGEITREVIDGLIETATSDAAASDEAGQAAADKRVSDTKALLDLI